MKREMHSKSIKRAVAAAMLTGALLFSLPICAQPTVDQVEVLTRGPVHEAFAESVSYEAQAGVIISTAPPELIEEMPPEQQLEGDNVAWIPGYWAWDDDQNDFIWISGIWRNLPPDRQWIPGYWNDLGDGRFQWTSGYWADSAMEEVEYVTTAPPSSVESGPNVPAPSADHNWVPGHWYWSDSRYVWRPGYWVPLRTNWTWVPSRYCWTPRGYVYVDGYWDHAVAQRGVLFAPVSFHNRVHAQPGYHYTPAIVVALNVFSSHLFVRPSCGHYYFGDYYAPRYRDSGFYASFTWHSHHHGYDPIYAYDRWDHRADRDWERRRFDDFNYFRDHEDARPPHTWAAMRTYRADRFNDGRNRSYAASLSDFSRDNKSGQRFRALDDDRRRQFVSQQQEMRKFGQQRRQMESRVNGKANDSQKAVAREKLNRSPIKGREAAGFANNDGPPKRPEGSGNKGRAESDKTAGSMGDKDNKRDGNKHGDASHGKGHDAKPDKKDSKDDGKRQDGEHANDRRNDRGVTPRDDNAREQGKGAAPGQDRDAKHDKNDKADRPADSTKETPKPKKPVESTPPKPERKSPESKRPETPKREIQPKPPTVKPAGPRIKDAPQRESRPEPKVRTEEPGGKRLKGLDEDNEEKKGKGSKR